MKKEGRKRRRNNMSKENPQPGEKIRYVNPYPLAEILSGDLLIVSSHDPLSCKIVFLGLEHIDLYYPAPTFFEYIGEEMKKFIITIQDSETGETFGGVLEKLDPVQDFKNKIEKDQHEDFPVSDSGDEPKVPTAVASESIESEPEKKPDDAV